MTATNLWPELQLAEWRDTYDTLHMWTQIVGKIRLAVTPLVNHWWNAALYITPRGLTTSAMFYKGLLCLVAFVAYSSILIRRRRPCQLLLPYLSRIVSNILDRKIHR